MLTSAKFEKALSRLTETAGSQSRILLAVSGGIDSMTMAALFRSSSWASRCGVAHVNFCLRENDCDLDQELVRQWASREGIPFHTVRFDTHAYAREHSVSTQMAARELRYGWFFRLMDEQGYDLLAVAHNRDDRVETLFLNLLRGTGYRGLLGIRESNGRIVRPLSEFSREEITAYAVRYGVPYRDDRTNAESHYHRNRLRNVVFPEFRKINPSFLATVSRNMSHFAQAVELLDEMAAEIREAVVSRDGDRTVVRAGALAADRHRDFWCYSLLSEYGFNPAQIAAITASAGMSSGKRFRSPTHELVTVSGAWHIYPLSVALPEEFAVSGPGTYRFGNIAFRLSVYDRPDSFLPIPAAGQLFFDADRVRFPMCCRGWRPADKMRPFGMERGTKKLSDLFVDLKVDVRRRQEQPVLTHRIRMRGDEQEQIVLLPGLRLDDRFKVTARTRRIGDVCLL